MNKNLFKTNRASEAAKKAWETIRRKKAEVEAAQQLAAQASAAKRSAAAKKAWATRKQKKAEAVAAKAGKNTRFRSIDDEGDYGG